MEAKAVIREFLLTKVLKGGALRDDESFWETRAIDSLGILRLIAFLEDTFKIKVPGRDVTAETFSSIDSVHRYLAGRLASKS